MLQKDMPDPIDSEHDFPNSNDELRALDAPPQGTPPDPEPRTALQELPFGKLLWQDFEKLTYRLVEFDGASPEYVSRYGVAGNAQEGIDIYARLSDGAGYVVYQCKRYQSLHPGDITKAVDEFLQHKWSRSGSRFAGRFVFCTSHPVSGQSVADAIETQAKRLHEHSPPIVFDAWGQERLSKEMKSHPDLVEDFFGPAFVDLFVPGGAGRHPDALAELNHRVAELADLVQTLAARQSVIVSTLSWAPLVLRLALESLATDDGPAFVTLQTIVGEPPDIKVVLANIEAPAIALRSAPAATWRALALMAEEKGEWAASSTAWERAAELSQDDYASAGDYVSAAASSHIQSNHDRQAAMLEHARERFAKHPRLLIEDARDLEPREQLELLDGVELRDVVDVALVEAQRGLACMLLPDLGQAEMHVARSTEALPGSAASEMVKLNLLVQRARLNQVDGRNQQVGTLQSGYRQALAIRDGLQRQRRWAEAARVLMLAADILGLQGEFESAHDLLRSARAEELADAESAEILGHTAVRNLAPRIALELTADAPETDGIRLVRAIATLDDARTSLSARASARGRLNDIIASGSGYATEAAFATLVDAMARGRWSDEAEAHLKSQQHERPAMVLKAFYLGEQCGDWEGAYALFDGLDDRRWVRPTRLRLAARWGRHSVIKQAADELMAESPGQGLKLECGRAYGKVGAYGRSREVLTDVARDETAPPAVRAEACRLLVITTGFHQNDWRAADRFHRNWVELRPGDTRASAMAVTIANRLRQASTGR